jgi:hypothetical protein
VKMLIRLVASVAILASVQLFASAQQLDPTQPGALYGYACTDMDQNGVVGHKVYRVRLTDGLSVERGTTNVLQELEGFLSADNFTSIGRSELFGVAEAPDGTGGGGPSILVRLTPAALNPSGVGSPVGTGTGITVGTEAGSAYDFINGGIAYTIASDDLTRTVGGINYPATALYMVDLNTGVADPPGFINLTEGLHLDGLAFGANGVLYASDARLTDTLYRYNFSTEVWEPVGPFNVAGENFSEDSGMGCYRGVSGNETNLYFITEGDGATRVARLWRIQNNASGQPTGQATFVAELRLGSGAEVPEDVEGFDIPYLPLQGQQPE